LELRGRRDIVSTALKRDPWALRYASKRLRADRLLVLTAIALGGWGLLTFASRDLREHLKATVRDAVRNLAAFQMFLFGFTQDARHQQSTPGGRASGRALTQQTSLEARGILTVIDGVQSVPACSDAPKCAFNDKSFVEKRRKTNDRSEVCRLHVLSDLGDETATGFKKSIAAFLGVPTGELLSQTRNAFAVM
jgi:hypothetical protein